MALPVTADVDFCSNALLMLGADRITSLSEDNDAARLCNSLVDPTRDAVLRAHPWNFAIRRQTLNLLVGAPVWRFARAFQLPSDPYCLRVLRTDADLVSGWAWKIEGRQLVTNLSSVKIEYIARITDVASYDSLFLDALTYRMAEKLAFPLTGSFEKAKGFRELYLGVLTEARSIDGLEGTPEQLTADDLIIVR